MAMMTTGNPASLADQFAALFSKKLMSGVAETLVLNNFGTKYDLPTNTGNNSITMFQWNTAADGTAVSNLTEGTTLSTYREVGLRKLNVPLTQVGQALKVSDILNYGQLFSALQEGIRALTLDASLHLDTVVRNALQGVTSATGIATGLASARTTDVYGNAVTKIYAGAATNFAGLAGTVYLTPSDLLDAATLIRLDKNVSLNEKFSAIVDPSVAGDLLKDTTVMNIAYYNTKTGVSDIQKGSLGEIYGVNVQQHTNAYRETTGGTEGTYVSGGGVVSTYVLTDGAFGTVNYSGQSPYSPSVVIVDKPDKSDILNQNIFAGWKAHWAVQVLNAKKARILKSNTRAISS